MKVYKICSYLDILMFYAMFVELVNLESELLGEPLITVRTHIVTRWLEGMLVEFMSL